MNPGSSADGSGFCFYVRPNQIPLPQPCNMLPQHFFQILHCRYKPSTTFSCMPQPCGEVATKISPVLQPCNRLSTIFFVRYSPATGEPQHFFLITILRQAFHNIFSHAATLRHAFHNLFSYIAAVRQGRQKNFLLIAAVQRASHNIFLLAAALLQASYNFC